MVAPAPTISRAGGKFPIDPAGGGGFILALSDISLGQSGQLQQGGPPPPPPPPLGTVSSAGVFDSTGALVRTLWSVSSNDPRVANPAAAWDGLLEDASTVAPTGSYVIKVLTHNVGYTWEGCVGSTSPNHLLNNNYYTHAGVMQSMAITDAGEMYYATSYSERFANQSYTHTATPQIKFDVPLVVASVPPAGINDAQNCCTDGTLAYYCYNSYGSTSYIFAVNIATKYAYSFSGGTGSFYGGNTILSSSTVGFISGLAVQKSGSYLFASYLVQNQILVANKTTGALVQTVAVSFNPSALATNPVTGELWAVLATVNLGAANFAQKFTVNGDGTLTATAQITGLVNAQAIAVSPDGSTVLIADGGSSQQVKAFNNSDGSVKTAWGSSGTLGLAGGYNTTNGPAVTNTKFMFFGNNGLSACGTFLAYAPDGSFWLGDGGNNRSQHFSSGNSPSYIEQIAYIPTVYSMAVCGNDDTRVFVGYLEFKIDYSKPLAPGNGSWTLANNWFGTNITSPITFGILGFLATRSNGRTYVGITGFNGASTSFKNICEMTSTGLRDTGTKYSTDYTISIDNNFNLWQVLPSSAGVPITWHKNPFTGFDGSNNPTWQFDPSLDDYSTWPIAFTSATPPALFPFVEFDNPASPLANGTFPVVNTHGLNNPQFTWNHLGGIDATSGAIKFSSWPVVPSNTYPNPFGEYPGAPSAPTVPTGNTLYPEPPYWPFGTGMNDLGLGGYAYKAGTTDVFGSLRAEGWGNGQINQWYHWHESGLLIAEFGHLQPVFAASYLVWPYCPDGANPSPPDGSDWRGAAGAAGNTNASGIAFQNGKYYIYHTDEWYQGGLHRWCVDNLGSVAITNTNVSWNSGSYVPHVPDPHNLLDGLPYNQLNLPDGSAGWHRNPTTDNLTGAGGDSPTSPTLRIYTNSNLANPHNPPDIAFQANWASQTITLYKDWTRSNTHVANNWTLNAILFNGATFMDILDTTGKKIFRLSITSPNNFNYGIFVNGATLKDPSVNPNSFAFFALVGQPQPLTVAANINANTMTVTYCGYTITVPPNDAGANINDATLRLQFSYVGGVSGGYQQVDIMKLLYTEAAP